MPDYPDLIFILSMIMQSGCKWIRQDIYILLSFRAIGAEMLMDGASQKSN
jgi:hypothetical protein